MSLTMLMGVTTSAWDIFKSPVYFVIFSMISDTDYQSFAFNYLLIFVCMKNSRYLIHIDNGYLQFVFNEIDGAWSQQHKR